MQLSKCHLNIIILFPDFPQWGQIIVGWFWAYNSLFLDFSKFLFDVDIDTILVSIRIASYGHSLELESKCPKCEEEASYGLDLLNVLAHMKSADYDTGLELNDMTIKFRPLTYKEMNQAAMAQFDTQRAFVKVT